MRTILQVVVIALVASACGDDALVIRTVNEYNEALAVPGVRVQVNDEEWVTTGDNGEASFGVIAPPYTVRVHQTEVGPVSGAQFVDVWQLPDQNLNPLVIPVDGSGGERREAYITGTVTGRSGAPGSVVQVIGGSGLTQVEPDGTFELWYTWFGPTPNSGVLRVFESDDATPPSRYTGYASQKVVVEGSLASDPDPAGSLTGIVLDLQPVAEAHVSGQVTVPADFTSADLTAQLSLNFPELGWGASATGQPAAFDYVFPDIPGAQPRLLFFALAGGHSETARLVALPASGLDIVLPAPVELIEPASGASIDFDTVFRWNTTAGAYSYNLRVQCSAPDSSLHVNYREIATTITQVSLPVIPGLVLPPGAKCSWSVGARFPPGHADESRHSASVRRDATMVL